MLLVLDPFSPSCERTNERITANVSFSLARLLSHRGPEETGHAECLQKPSSWETQR